MTAPTLNHRQHRLPRRSRRGRRRRAPHRRGDLPGAHRPARVAEADRQRELRVAGGAARDGQLAVGQVRRGHHRPPLLRRLPEHRHRRVGRGRARPGGLRLARTPTCSRTRASTRTSSPTGPSSRPASRRPTLEKAGLKNVNDMAEADWQQLRRELGNQRLLGMSLDAGGHLTHGFRPNVSGKMFEQASYGTEPGTGLVDYAALREQAKAFRPLIIVAGYSAYPRLINFATMREIADEVGATLMVDMAHFAGLVAGGVLTGDENPVPFADVTTTTTHKSLRGPRGGMVLCTDEYAPFVDRGCPLVLGGPLGNIMAAKAVALAEARTDEFRALRPADRRQRPRARGRPAQARGHARHRRHRQSPGTAGCFGLRAHRPAGGGCAARRRPGDQPQRDPAGPERRLVHLRNSPRHAGAHDARLRRGRPR